MDKIMLTVLKGLETVCIQLLRGMLTRSLVNERASRFYQAMGYVTLSLTRWPSTNLLRVARFRMDPTSPDYIGEDDSDSGEEDECDYEILSKAIR